jgi:hypothetical protein
MDPLVLSLLITKAILINARNLMQAIDKAKAGDGKVTSDEIKDIVFDTAIKSLDDMGAGDFSSLLTVGVPKH